MLEEKVKKLASATNLAAVSTVMPDGSPQTTPMWVDCNDDELLLNTEIHRRKFLNIKRDPRVTVMIFDANNPYDYVEVRGEVSGTIGGQEARAHIDHLSQKYVGQPYNPQMIGTERVIFKVKPKKVATFSR